MVVIHQPDFLPYLGFFHRFLSADLWVVLDHVQFQKNNSKSWHNRDKIKNRKSEAQWLTVSVKKSSLHTPIKNIELADNSWRIKNINLITESYYKAPFFDEIMPIIKKIYSYQCNRMVDFNLNTIDRICDILNIRINKIKSSQLLPEHSKSLLLINLIKKVGYNRYLSGVGAKSYLDENLFERYNINVIWQNFKHPTYKQINGDFIPYLSVIDVLFNCGIDRTNEILRSC